jgi:xanthine dehydrogenase YagR molybdenum-binding subunit
MARLEGRAKVTGRAAFVDDLREDALGFPFLTAVPVTSTVARGRVARIDAAAALAVPGVRLVMTHANAPRWARSCRSRCPRPGSACRCRTTASAGTASAWR